MVLTAGHSKGPEAQSYTQISIMDEDEKFDGPSAVEKTDMLDKAGVFEYDKISEREHEILEACRLGDLEKLRDIAESPGGFMMDRLRQSACKCLICFQSYTDFLCTRTNHIHRAGSSWTSAKRGERDLSYSKFLERPSIAQR